MMSECPCTPCSTRRRSCIGGSPVIAICGIQRSYGWNLWPQKNTPLIESSHYFTVHINHASVDHQEQARAAPCGAHDRDRVSRDDEPRPLPGYARPLVPLYIVCVAHMWPLKRAATAGFVGCAPRTFPFLVGVFFRGTEDAAPFCTGSAVFSPVLQSPRNAPGLTRSRRPWRLACRPRRQRLGRRALAARHPKARGHRRRDQLGACWVSSRWVVAWLLGCRRRSRYRYLHFSFISCRLTSRRSPAAPVATAQGRVPHRPERLQFRLHGGLLRSGHGQLRRRPRGHHRAH